MMVTLRPPINPPEGEKGVLSNRPPASATTAGALGFLPGA